MKTIKSGPIPGANFTSDTKNYPWHQPPRFTDISDALDKIVEKLMQNDADKKVTALAEIGIPLYRVSSLIIMEGVSDGLWTVDMALLLVGPVTKILEIICVQYGVEYDLGIEDKKEFVTGMFVNAKAGKTKKNTKLEAELPEIKTEAEEQEEPEAEAPMGFASPKTGEM